MSGQAMDIKLLERNYRVMCPDGQEGALREAAQTLDSRMAETQTATRLSNMEQIAVMTALNLCHEWVQAKQSHEQQIKALEDKVKLLQGTIEKAMADEQPSGKKK